MSFSSPSHVSATTGLDHQYPVASASPCLIRHAIVASCTVPTLWVLVIMTGPSRKPDSSTHVVPVISPAPFNANQPAKTGSLSVALPRGTTAVTPVRTGPSPTLSAPDPRMIVLCPTVTPRTSVIALPGPGVPSKGTPRSRARGLSAAWTGNAASRPAARNSEAARFMRESLPPAPTSGPGSACRRPRPTSSFRPSASSRPSSTCRSGRPACRPRRSSAARRSRGCNRDRPTRRPRP